MVTSIDHIAGKWNVWIIYICNTFSNFCIAELVEIFIISVPCIRRWTETQMRAKTAHFDSAIDNGDCCDDNDGDCCAGDNDDML